MLSPQLLINLAFGLIWSALALYLLVWYRGAEQMGNFNLRTMGVLSALLALYNALRCYLEWRRLRHRKQVLHQDVRRGSPPAAS
ncbi:MAG: hypothetical protein NZM42_07215 [Gemmatales bacterium]|nr:hypothetical protein [Gemmatales bacterium]MDW8223180.1 hypothetical protein [Gemmatales bacterium]